MPPTTPRSGLEHQAPHATRRIQGTIHVRATRRGYFDNHSKEQGEEFALESMEQFSENWMTLLDGTPAERATKLAEWRASKIEKMPAKTDEQREVKAEAERRAKAAAAADLRAIDAESAAEKSENDAKPEGESKPAKKGGKPKAEKSENDVL